MLLGLPGGSEMIIFWIDDNKTGEMRLINAYVDKRKGEYGDA